VSATASRTEAAIVVRDLKKSYGDVEALRGISLRIDRGEVFALLGPNGAGKTTATEILEGFRRRTSGEVRVLGRNPARFDKQARARIGIVLQSTGVDPYLTVAETVDLYRGFYPAPRPRDEVLELVGLREEGGTKVARLSGGQQRRLDVAVALAGDPELLFLDEPTTGFDPAARRSAWEVVASLADLGKTVFLTTHSMEEAQMLAHRVAVMRDGLIVAEGPPSTLGGRDLGRTTIRFRADDSSAIPMLGFRRRQDGTLELSTEEPTWILHELTTWAVARGLVLEGLEVHRPTLEDVYLELTGDTGEAER
jgi:ABC-2 type transport system ATP-binding protein